MEEDLVKRFLLYFESWPTESLIRLIHLYTNLDEKVAEECAKDPKIVELRTLIAELKEIKAADKVQAIRKAIYKICH